MEKIKDYATGKMVNSTPEEVYRQQFEHILIDDLGYPKSHIDIEVIIQRGAKRNAEEADIVVYKSEDKSQDNAYIVIEIETPKKTYDLQAMSYVTATTAPFCVWFAGFDKTSKGPFYHYRDMKTDPTKFKTIQTLPRYGEDIETVGLYRKDQLQPAKALKILFQRIHFKLYGEGPIKREENVAKEFIKIIFCKILDEYSPEDLCEFRATPREQETSSGQKKVADRIRKIYSELLLDPDFGELFAGEDLLYDDKWITYIVSELQGVMFTHPETNTDALGDAYEILIPSSLKGESGQFFTPREIVRFAVSVINPSYKKKELMLDTACGSGGFLTVGLEYIQNQIKQLYPQKNRDGVRLLLKDYAGKYIHGMDIEPLLFKIAKSYMAILGDGKTNIYQNDSLQPISKYPSRFNEKIKPGTVDIITTNPPFGTKIDITDKEILKIYDLGHKLKDGVKTNELLDGQDPDKLFLERDIQFLKNATEHEDGGRMVIVLPKQNLSGAEEESVELRKWILNNIDIFAVVDLPREAFQPHTGTKTSLLFCRKVKDVKEDHPIFMAVSESVGHDRRGNVVYRKDNSGEFEKDDNGNNIIWNDLPYILEQYHHFEKGEPIDENSGNEGNPSCFLINKDEVKKDASRRIDAWYWDPQKNQLAKDLMDTTNPAIKEVANLGDLVVSHGIYYPGRHTRNYVENNDTSVAFYSGTQILQTRPFDIKYQPKNYAPAKNHFVKKGWILITRSGTTGRVVMVNDEMDGKMVTEHVIRVICDETIINPYYVYAVLSSDKIGRQLLDKGIYASVVDHISPQFVSTIPIPRLTGDLEEQIAEKVKKAEELRSKASSIINSEIDALENMLLTDKK